MGYNSKCTDQNCSQGCCNSYGNCPTTSYYSSSTSRKCKYYYTQSQPMDSGAVAGIAVGAIVGFTLFIIILTCCIIKCCQKRALQQAAANISNKQMNVTTQQLTTQYTDPNHIVLQNQPPYGQTYGQTYGQPYVQSYGQPYVQQPVQQPIYGSPEQALFGQQPPAYPVWQANNQYGPGPIVR